MKRLIARIAVLILSIIPMLSMGKGRSGPSMNYNYNDCINDSLLIYSVSDAMNYCLNVWRQGWTNGPAYSECIKPHINQQTGYASEEGIGACKSIQVTPPVGLGLL